MATEFTTKSSEDVAAMGRAGAVIGTLFSEIEEAIVPGVATADLDRFVDDFVRAHEGAVPAFKGLYGFPGSACISVNSEIVHGIPGPRQLRDGDLVTIDVGVRRDGWCADSAFTYPVGAVSDEAARLLEVTRAALDAAVAAARAGARTGDVGAAVEAVVAGKGMEIARDLVGHGIGREVHEEPQVPNQGRPGRGPLLRAGATLAIEPMVALGSGRIRTLEDGWTTATADGSLSAHFEHTVAVTSGGPRILTGGAIWSSAARPRAALASPDAVSAAPAGFVHEGRHAENAPTVLGNRAGGSGARASASARTVPARPTANALGWLT